MVGVGLEIAGKLIQTAENQHLEQLVIGADLPGLVASSIPSAFPARQRSSSCAGESSAPLPAAAAWRTLPAHSSNSWPMGSSWSR